MSEPFIFKRLTINGKIKLPFQLNNTENDIEVRLWVGDGDDLSVVAYKINLITN
jgi:hypothetical protein